MAITTDHASLTFLAPRNEFPPCLLKKPTRVCISNFGPFPKPRLTISYLANNTPVYKKEDNLSSVEKMRIEVTKLREEVKISESDCGSSSVQVVQLTSQIKHLSSSLHRKDKQSRRGLVGMVQKRKKLLKYLKRTDSDSYHLVLSKLGLRDKF